MEKPRTAVRPSDNVTLCEKWKRKDTPRSRTRILSGLSDHLFADDCAIEHAQGGEQWGRPVALVIVRPCSAASLLDR